MQLIQVLQEYVKEFCSWVSGDREVKPEQDPVVLSQLGQVIALTHDQSLSDWEHQQCDTGLANLFLPLK